MKQGRKLAGRPAELLKRALEVDPDNPKAIAMSGAAAAERGDADSAIKLYQRLQDDWFRRTARNRNRSTR